MTKLAREFWYDWHKGSKKQGSSYKIDSTDLEQVDSFKYVGSVVNKGRKIEEEIKQKQQKGIKNFMQIKRWFLANNKQDVLQCASIKV